MFFEVLISAKLLKTLYLIKIVTAFPFSKLLYPQGHWDEWICTLLSAQAELLLQQYQIITISLAEREQPLSCSIINLLVLSTCKSQAIEPYGMSGSIVIHFVGLPSLWVSLITWRLSVSYLGLPLWPFSAPVKRPWCSFSLSLSQEKKKKRLLFKRGRERVHKRERETVRRINFINGCELTSYCQELDPFSWHA